MQFFLSLLDDKVKLKEENPAIGIIICKNKNRTIVEYALKQTTKPIGIATYKITSHLPEKLLKHFPSKQELAEKITDLH
mgnify:FL=1